MSFVSFEWNVSPQVAFDKLTADYIAAIRRGVRAIANRRQPEIQAWMIDNAPWTDRTGNARQTLNTTVEDLAMSMVEIVLAGGVEYQIWLELAHGGAYGIIGPAVDYWGPVIWADVRALLR